VLSLTQVIDGIGAREAAALQSPLTFRPPDPETAPR
jgi:hypothetical protein